MHSHARTHGRGPTFRFPAVKAAGDQLFPRQCYVSQTIPISRRPSVRIAFASDSASLGFGVGVLSSSLSVSPGVLLLLRTSLFFIFLRVSPLPFPLVCRPLLFRICPLASFCSVYTPEALDQSLHSYIRTLIFATGIDLKLSLLTLVNRIRTKVHCFSFGQGLVLCPAGGLI